MATTAEIYIFGPEIGLEIGEKGGRGGGSTFQKYGGRVELILNTVKGARFPPYSLNQP